MPMKQILLVAKLPKRDQDVVLRGEVFLNEEEVVAVEQLFARYQIDRTSIPGQAVEIMSPGLCGPLYRFN
jgi:hypothetical protein